MKKSAMKAILEGNFGTVSMPLRWYAFGLGVMLSVVLRMVELPALGEWIGLGALVALCIYVVGYSRQAKGEA